MHDIFFNIFVLAQHTIQKRKTCLDNIFAFPYVTAFNLCLIFPKEFPTSRAIDDYFLEEHKSTILRRSI